MRSLQFKVILPTQKFTCGLVVQEDTVEATVGQSLSWIVSSMTLQSHTSRNKPILAGELLRMVFSEYDGTSCTTPIAIATDTLHFTLLVVTSLLHNTDINTTGKKLTWK